jgi:hypothetical protein
VQIITTSKLSFRGSIILVSNTLLAWNKSEIIKAIIGFSPELPLIQPTLVLFFKTS